MDCVCEKEWSNLREEKKILNVVMEQLNVELFVAQQEVTSASNKSST